VTATNRVLSQLQTKYQGHRSGAAGVLVRSVHLSDLAHFAIPGSWAPLAAVLQLLAGGIFSGNRGPVRFIKRLVASQSAWGKVLQEAVQILHRALRTPAQVSTVAIFDGYNIVLLPQHVVLMSKFTIPTRQTRPNAGTEVLGSFLVVFVPLSSRKTGPESR
jgi:hypothetical protein